MDDPKKPDLTNYLGIPPSFALKDDMERTLYHSDIFDFNKNLLIGLFKSMVGVTVVESRADQMLRNAQLFYCRRSVFLEKPYLVPFVACAMNRGVYRIKLKPCDDHLTPVVFSYSGMDKSGIPLSYLRLRFYDERKKKDQIGNLLTKQSTVVPATQEAAELIVCKPFPVIHRPFEALAPEVVLKDYQAELLEKNYRPDTKMQRVLFAQYGGSQDLDTLGRNPDGTRKRQRKSIQGKQKTIDLFV